MRFLPRPLPGGPAIPGETANSGARAAPGMLALCASFEARRFGPSIDLTLTFRYACVCCPPRFAARPYCEDNDAYCEDKNDQDPARRRLFRPCRCRLEFPSRRRSVDSPRSEHVLFELREPASHLRPGLQRRRRIDDEPPGMLRQLRTRASSVRRPLPIGWAQVVATRPPRPLAAARPRAMLSASS